MLSEPFEILEDFSKYNAYTDSFRYKSLKISINDQPYFYKQALTEWSKSLLENEVAFNNWAMGAELGFTVPKVIEYDGTTALFEWVEAQYLISEKPGQSVTSLQLEKLAKLLNMIDDLNNSSFIGVDPEFEFSTWNQQIENWLYKPLQYGLIEPIEVQAAVKHLTRYAHCMKPALQHGDLFGWHVFDTEQITVFDCEHASNKWPRYFDLARLFVYTSTYTNLADDLKRLVISQYQNSGLNSEEFIGAISAPILIQSIYNLNDAVSDFEISKQSNEQVIKDLRGQARQVFLNSINHEWANWI